jgi:hypothetical protein
MLCIAAAAGLCASANAQVNVSVTLRPEVIRFSPGEQPLYVLFVNLAASGFADETNIENVVRVASGNNSFLADVHPALYSGGSTSPGLSSVEDLNIAINEAGTWTMTVTDGLTGVTSNYSMTVTTPGIDGAYLRPISLDLTNGSILAPNPTINFSIDPAPFQESEFSSGGAFLSGNLPGHFVASPSVLPTDTSWTPDGPLAIDTYFLDMRFQNDSNPALVGMSHPVPIGDTPELGSFDVTVVPATEAQANSLYVGSAAPYQVSVTFQPDVISFSPLDPPVYILGIGLNATGFVDENNTDNFVQLISGSSAFSGDFYPARGQGSGTAGSYGYLSVEDLSATINDPNPWTLRLTDGVTGIISEYSLYVSTPGIAQDYVRPMTLDTLPNSSITDYPTFGFTLDPAASPDAEYTSAFAFLLGNLPGHVYGDPPITPADRSWTPTGPIEPDSYYIVVGMESSAAPSSLIDLSPLSPSSTTTRDVLFTPFYRAGSYAQSGGVISSPYCPADFNQDGGVDGADVSAFFDEWEAGNSDADVNRDGGVDGADVDVFFSAWESGGC